MKYSECGKKLTPEEESFELKNFNYFKDLSDTEYLCNK